MIFASLTFSAALAAEPSDCASLAPDDRARAAALMEIEHVYAGCDDTVARCLSAAPPVPLAARLAGEICRRVDAGESDEDVSRHIGLRARSMAANPVVPIDTRGAPVAGVPAAPVEVVVFACLRCPFCARLVPELETAVTTGSLRGKARVAFKAFPLKGHPGSTESGLGALAAHAQDRFWPFVRGEYAEFEAFSVDRLGARISAVGGDPAAWRAAYADPATRAALVASKREGIALGVDSTPTVFVGGRRYEGSMDIVQLVDVIGEEYERRTGQGSPPGAP